MPLNLEYGYFGADLCICIGNLNFFGRLVLLDNVPAYTIWWAYKIFRHPHEIYNFGKSIFVSECDYRKNTAPSANSSSILYYTLSYFWAKGTPVDPIYRTSRISGGLSTPEQESPVDHNPPVFSNYCRCYCKLDVVWGVYEDKYILPNFVSLSIFDYKISYSPYNNVQHSHSKNPSSHS